MKLFLSLALILLSAMIPAAPALAQTQAEPEAWEILVHLPTRPGVTQDFLLMKPGQARACVILLAGGDGALGLYGEGEEVGIGSLGGNFLVRSRELFAEQGLVVATLDAPSDRQAGMGDEFRSGAAHAQDVAVVAGYLRRETGLPVWLVGTSRGTVSAAGVALRLSATPEVPRDGTGAETLARPIDGVILSSTITRSLHGHKTHFLLNGVLSLDLTAIRVPVLLVGHASDQCEVTPARDMARIAEKLKNSPRVETRTMEGGRAAISEPCQAKSAHGYFGVEQETVAAMAEFIRANSRP